jgi:hypothetical protein
MRLPLLAAGVALPEVVRACELGYGFGVSVNVHAAASDVQWHGTDFNVAHAVFARQLAQQGGVKAYLHDESFSEFGARAELPMFDFIGLHGVWSWVSDENRRLITDFVRKHLRVGGVLYLSYNTLAGWAPMLPVRDLLFQHMRTADASRSIQDRVDAATEYVKTLLSAQPGYMVANTSVNERVQNLLAENASYLTHEYFTDSWKPMSFAEVLPDLEGAGLTYAGSADLRDHFDELNLRPSQQQLISDTADVSLRETVRDFCMNRSFRREYWVKSPRFLDADEKEAALRETRVVLAVPGSIDSLDLRGALGTVRLHQQAFRQIVDVLGDHRPASLAEIDSRVRERGFSLSFAEIVKAVMLLAASGALLTAEQDASIESNRGRATRLNAAICERALVDERVQYLASPVSASAIFMPRLQQLFILARTRGLTSPTQWANFAAEILREFRGPANGAAAMKTPEELEAVASRFSEVHLPVLIALGVVDP